MADTAPAAPASQTPAPTEGAPSPSLLSGTHKAPEAAPPSPGSTSPATPGETPPAPSADGQQAKPADDKAEAPPTDGKAAADAPAGELELKSPEGFTVDTEFLDAFKAHAKELGLKQEGAQKLVDLYAQRQKALVERATSLQEEEAKAWVAGVRADPELGGAKYDSTIATANKALSVYGTPALNEAIALTGIGNHPEFVRFAKRIGEALREDSIAGTPGARTVPSQTEKLLEMYPSMRPSNS